MNPSDTTDGFEESLNALEERVRKLESGETSLDEALALYEQGVALARRCHEHLDRAEQRVAALSRGAHGIEEQPLEDPSQG
ncbi:MAG: exodeoxyribonuclease VII small subunit [Deltaproteobacteria bacterium]|nr:MAG: exodeoxyribonuclease VII small subunit [Deltaproteobacteria bacterium]